MKNLRFTFRMLKGNPLLLFVGLPGLAIGLSAVLLLSVYLKHELSFDQHFDTKDRVLRLYNKVTEKSQTEVYGIGLRKAYTDIPSQVPEVEAATQFYEGGKVNVKNNDKQFPSLVLLYGDPGFFDVFGINLIFGNKKEALLGERNVVLTSSTALKVFNRLDCVGQVIQLSDKPFTVTGVISDLPPTTHFHFELLAPIQSLHVEEWGSLEFFSYFLIRENANLQAAGQKITALNDKLMKTWGEEYNVQAESGTEPLTKIHLHTKVDFDLSPKGSLTNINIVGGIALFILLIALVNFINLYILQGEKRIAEIASRKSVGANSKDLARMFFTETGIIGLIAFGLSIFLTFLAQNYFSDLMQRPLSISTMFSPSGIILILGFLAGLIFVTGAYPSFYLSRINLVSGLKGKTEQINRKNNLSASAVMIQFIVTVFLVSSMVVIYSQVRYLKEIPLGFNPEHVFGTNSYNPQMRAKYQSIEEELSNLPFVESVGSSFVYMGGGGSGQGIKIYGSTNNYSSIEEYRVQPGFCETLQLELVGGRFFRADKGDKKAVILNEAAARMLGLQNPVGAQVGMSMYNEPSEVIGVVKNFYGVTHPGEAITPLVLTDNSDSAGRSYLRISGDFTSDRQAQVAGIMHKYDPEFILGSFPLSDTYNAKFKEEDRVIKLVSAGTFLAMLISFTGLMALSMLHVNRRTKEIGIRRVAGCSIAEVMGILLKQTIILVLTACLIAFIPGYLAMQQWLTGFSDKVHLHAGYFLISGSVALLIALMAVSWQSWKAATRNPVEALRYE